MTTTYGTLSTIAGFPVEVELVRRSAQTAPESGFVARRTLRDNVSRQSGKPETRLWRLTFGPESFSGLLTQWRNAKGGALPLSWTPPPPDDGTAIPVRFLDGSLRVRHGPGNVYSAESMLEEVT